MLVGRFAGSDPDPLVLGFRATLIRPAPESNPGARGPNQFEHAILLRARPNGCKVIPVFVAAGLRLLEGKSFAVYLETITVNERISGSATCTCIGVDEA